MTRREMLQGTAAALAGVVAAAAFAVADAPPRIVRITAKKFVFEPREVTLKLGEPVLLELEALDREHGFDCSALGLRADLVPGRAVRLPLTPAQAGRFGFVCNVFCGEGHDDMDGTFIVEAG